MTEKYRLDDGTEISEAEFSRICQLSDAESKRRALFPKKYGDDLLDYLGVAQILHISRDQVVRLAREAKIGCVWVKRQRMFRRSHVRQFVLDVCAGKFGEHERVAFWFLHREATRDNSQFVPDTRYDGFPRHILEQEQQGKCAICGATARYLVLDHDHVTDFVRGLLCPTCNSLLGMASDSVERLERAIEYLRTSTDRVKALIDRNNRSLVTP